MSGHGHRGQYYPVQRHGDPGFHTSHPFDLQQKPHQHPGPTDGLPHSDTRLYGRPAINSAPALPTQSSRYHPYPRTPPPPQAHLPSNPVIVRPVATRALNREEVAKLIGLSITDTLGISDSRRARGRAVDHQKIPTHVSSGRSQETGRNNVERRPQGDVKLQTVVAGGEFQSGDHSRSRGEIREEYVVPARADLVRAACLSDVPVLPECIALDSCSSPLDRSASRSQAGEGSSPHTFFEANCRAEWAAPCACRSSVSFSVGPIRQDP